MTTKQITAQIKPNQLNVIAPLSPVGRKVATAIDKNALPISPTTAGRSPEKASLT